MNREGPEFMMIRTKLLYALVLALPATLTTGCEKKAETAPPTPRVEVVQVTPQDVPITREWVGTLLGLVNADIRPQVAGPLIRQVYSNGSFVRKGDVLFDIDPRPFQASVDQAKANVDKARAAVLQSKAALEEAKANQDRAEAELGKTQIDVQRYTPLAAVKAISQQELDNAVQANLAAKAQVEAMKASVQTATSNIAAQTSAVAASEAELQTAQLNLGYTKVTSLIDGVAGIANAQVGDYVAPQMANPLTTISKVDPILAQFSLSEQEYLAVATHFGNFGAEVEAALRKIVFELVLANGSVFPQKGHLRYVDREVDVRTGAINIQVEFPNPGNVLRPGGYATIRAVTRIQKGALAIPQRAVSDLQGRFMVAVVGADDKVALREVKTGEKVGPLWVMTEGLKAGDRVVAEGTQKVREGMQVNPQPYNANPQAGA